MSKECKWCQKEEIVFRETPESIHYGRTDCKSCGKFNAWIKNPDVIRSKNPSANKHSVRDICRSKGYKDDFCFFCLRTRDKLGKKETLTIDHIEERDKGGADTLENKQILCSACHKLKNWARLYMNWHFNEVKEDEQR